MLHTTASDGVDVRAVDEGAGPAIVVLHPGLDDGSSWRKVAERLTGRFRVVRLHRRQYRLDLAAARPCSIADEVRDVLAVAGGIGAPTVLVGHSSGAVVALEALVAAPGAFAGAVLYEPPALIGRWPVDQALAQARAALAAGRPGKALAIFLQRVVGYPRWPSRLAGAWVAALPRLRALVPSQLDDCDAILRLGVRLDAYAGIDVPTVLLGGERTPTHLRARLDALARVMPRAEQVVLAGRGHDADRKAPAEVAAVITELADRVLR